MWEISSAGAWETTVRISYLLSNIDRLITYKLIADKKETQVDFRSYLVLRNFSGEDFTQARVLLDYGEAFEEGIAHEETKQLLFLKPGPVPIEKVWRFDSGEKPWDPEAVYENVGIPVSYRIENSKKTGLGGSLFWKGKCAYFRKTATAVTIFLGEDNSALVPVGEEMEVYIGDSRDIVVTQRKMEEKKVNLRRNKHNRVILFDSDEVIKAKIENFKDSPARLVLVEHIPGEWDMEKASLEYVRKNASTLEFEIVLPAQGKMELVMEYSRRNLRP